MDKKILAFIAGGLMASTFILYAVSNGVKNWSTYSLSVSGTSAYSYNMGLWQYCTSVLSVEACLNIDCPSSSTASTSSTSSSSSTSSAAFGSSACSKFMSARAFLTLACILAPITAACFFLWGFLNDRLPEFIPLVLKIATSVCLLCGIIGVAIGIAVTLQPYEASSSSTSTSNVVTIGAGAIIGIIAIISNVVTAIVAAMI